MSRFKRLLGPGPAIALVLLVPLGQVAGASSRISGRAGPRALTVNRSEASLGVAAQVTPHAEKAKRRRATNFTLFSPPLLAVSDSGPAGRASAKGLHSASVGVVADQNVVHTDGTLDVSATCSRVSCFGDHLASADADGGMSIEFAAAGKIPYVLQVAVNASGRAKSDCASISLQLTGDDVVEDIEVTGTASDPGCAAGNAHHVRDTFGGVLDATSSFELVVDAEACCLDPGTRRTDTIHADWLVNLTAGPPCDVVGTESGERLDGTSSGEVICGLGGEDTINGLGGDDIIFGGNDKDIIMGGAGSDRIFGLAGDDNLQGQGDQDSIFGGTGKDIIEGGDAIDHLLGEGGDDHRIYGGYGSDTINGGPGNDGDLAGGSLANVVAGGGGNDDISGGPGDDLILGRCGEDLGVSADVCPTDPARANESDQDDIRGESGDDTIHGDVDLDDLSGGPDDDHLFGGPGRDHIDGGAGNELNTGSSVNVAAIQGGGGPDIIFGGPGDDLIEGNDGNDEIRGEGGSDKLRGNDDADCLVGDTAGSNPRKDVLIGNAGNDILLAKDGGRDELNGNSGFDRAKKDPVDNVQGVENQNFQGGCP